MTDSREIPADEWVRFCDSFSREHLGWPVTMELLSRELGPQHLAENLPLDGISFDTKGTRPSSVEVSAGQGLDRHIAHTIDLPLSIWLTQDPDGRGTLKIEPAEGPVLLVHYHRA
jgi:hypothetical protein